MPVKKKAARAAKASRRPIITSREKYTVDGGALVGVDIGRIDLSGREVVDGCKLAASLFVHRDELGFYPIGAVVFVTVERIK